MKKVNFVERKRIWNKLLPEASLCKNIEKTYHFVLKEKYSLLDCMKIMIQINKFILLDKLL